MKNLFYVFLVLFFAGSCNSKTSKPQQKVREINYAPPFKKEKNKSSEEHLDSVKKVYSNFKYEVAFDAPDNWHFDSGVTEHNIFRAYQPDSAITFSVNVIETIEDPRRNKNMDMWKVYDKAPTELNSSLELIEQQLNTKIEELTVKKTFLRSHSALKRTFKYKVREFDMEYYNTAIMYQTLKQRNKGNVFYTFTLNIPTIFYNEDPEHYENLFLNVYFLKDKERLDEMYN